jgi:hypothetical protein
MCRPTHATGPLGVCLAPRPAAPAAACCARHGRSTLVAPRGAIRATARLSGEEVSLLIGLDISNGGVQQARGRPSLPLHSQSGLAARER